MKAPATWIAVVCASASLLAGQIVHADPATNPVQKLNDIESQIRSDRDKVEQLNQTAQRFTRDQNLLRERLIQAASSAQLRERDLNIVEQRLAELETQEAAAMHAMNEQRSKLASLLAVLQRMGREPPPALIVHPDDASAAARSAMLLSSVVPSAQIKSKELAQSLATLRVLRQKQANERLRVAALASASEKDRNVLVLLLEQRRLLTEQTVQDLSTTRQRIEAMGDQAKDIRALIASLTEDERRPQPHGQGLVVTNQIASMGAAKSVSLDMLKGRLKWPTNGALAGRFGAQDGAGGKLAGIYLSTPPSATVTSPCDGKIMFAGPFRGYGQMLIISANGGYHVLLAGLTNIDGVVGQVVLAGEPLGRMGRERASSQATLQPGSATTADGGRQLYIEFRRNDVPVDPVPWFAALKERVSG